MDNLLTVDELCEYLKVTRTWVQDKVSADELPCIRLSRRMLRFRRSEIDAYLSSKSITPVG